jgi:DUF4097 and DUF4098 domain-containing protein YvlB
MKTKISIGVAFLIGISLSQGQTFSEKIVKEVGFETRALSNALIVANINGSIDVAGYEGEKIVLEVTKTIKAKTANRLEQGKKEIQLGMIDRADTLIFYVEGTCNKFGRNTNKEHNWGTDDGWSYNWSNCKGEHCDTPYDYTLNFKLKVPFSVNLLVSTINDGNIIVANMKGAMRANNINGSIKFSNIAKEASASTINGDVDVEYVKNPDKACRFYTLNGDINAWFQKGLAANLSFQSYNGEFYTNVEQLESLPVMVEKEQHGNGMRYKVNGNRFKIGNGGVPLAFETFNGDVYLKERTN